MAKTDSFREQHKNIVEAVKGLDALLIEANLKKDAQPATMALATLAGRLKIHLSMEDKSLYPGLAGSSDPTTKAIAEKFIKEMGGIGEVFTGYVAKWNKQTIQDDTSSFIKETKTIFSVLADRVKREESELYPLADK